MSNKTKRKNNKETKQDKEQVKQKKRVGVNWNVIKRNASIFFTILSFVVAVLTLYITWKIGKTANTINKKTQEITYSFSEDTVNRSSADILKKEFDKYFADQNISATITLQNRDSGKNEMQTVRIIDAGTNEIDQTGVMFSLYAESNEICGDITGIIVSKNIALNGEDSDYTNHFINSEYFNINASQKSSNSSHLFIIDEIGVHMIMPQKRDHISFLIAKPYIQNENVTEKLIYVTLKGYSGSLKQFAIRVIFNDEDANFTIIDKNDIFDLDKVKNFLITDYKRDSTTSEQITNNEVVARSKQMDEDFDAIANRYDR